MATAIDRIIRRILRWVDRLRGGRASPPVGVELERKAWGVLWRIDSSEPGVVGAWAVSHFESQSLLTISLISVAGLREDLAQGRMWKRSGDPFRAGSKSTFRSQFQQYLAAQGGLDARFVTHIILVAWRSQIPQSSGRRYLTTPIAQIPGDYQGGFTGAGDRYALAICDRVARQLLRKARPGIVDWQKIVTGIDWLELVEFHASAALGKSHTLQVRTR